MWKNSIFFPVTFVLVYSSCEIKVNIENELKMNLKLKNQKLS